MYSLIWQSVMWRPDKMRFLIAMKNPLPIRTAATARQRAPSRRADRCRIRKPSHEPGSILILIDALLSS